MPEIYLHRQVVGTTPLAIGFFAAALLCMVMAINRAWAPAIALVAILGAIAFLFSSLTISVDASRVSWYFGPGLWKYHVPRNNIGSVTIVRNSPLNGFGIRMRPGWRLYNVYGLDAVEMRLKSGDIIRLGTDDPNGLGSALRS